jgi:hypothetical protein
MSGDFAQNVDLVSKFATVAALPLQQVPFSFYTLEEENLKNTVLQMTVVDS